MGNLRPKDVHSVMEIIINKMGVYILLLMVAALPLVVDSQSSFLSPTPDPACFRKLTPSETCLDLRNTSAETQMCLGVKIPFSHTSLALTNNSLTLDEVQSKLRLWSRLQNVPQCWAMVQPYLCSVYLPKCSDIYGIKLPSKQLCERTRKPCQIVKEVNNGWPDFLQCDHPNFVSGCGPMDYDYVSFNTSSQCAPPLVRTKTPESWFPGVEGCGLPCENPLFTSEQHREAHIVTAAFGSLCLACTLFTVLTFIVDWKNASRYPALILFFINACFFLGSIGWMSQFVGDARTEIVCRKDGTVRLGEPQLGSKESMWCPVVFTIVYYSLIAGVSWYVMLAYAWCLTFTALHSGAPTADRPDPGRALREVLKSRTAYFHIISWCSPLVLTIVCLALSEIDGDSISGICFVGVFNHRVRAMFVLVPVGLAIVVGTFFLVKGCLTLIQIRKKAPSFIPVKTFSKVKATIVRLVIFTAVIILFVIVTFVVHIYIFVNEDSWKRSFREYMFCTANASLAAPSEESHCYIKDRPSLFAMEMHIVAFFGAGIAMSSWSWTRASVSAWERFFRWVFHKPSTKPKKLKRHRMIAQMFEKRKEINQGRVSISYRSSHDDPLGMKFDFNSGSEDELSSNFAMALPQLARRRGGVIFPVSSAARRYSDSDVTSVVSTRRVSRESLVSFQDEQYVIVQRDGLPAIAVPASMFRRSSRRDKRKKLMKTRKQRRRDRMGRARQTGGLLGSKSSSRKGSDSSVLSQLSAASLRFFKSRRRRNSPDSESVNSSMPPPETGKTNGLMDTWAIKPRPRLEFGPATREVKKGGDSANRKSKGKRWWRSRDVQEDDIELGLLGGEVTQSVKGSKTSRMYEALDLGNNELQGGSGSETDPSLCSRAKGGKLVENKTSTNGAAKQTKLALSVASLQNGKKKKTDEKRVDSTSTPDSSSEDSVEAMLWEQQMKENSQTPATTTAGATHNSSTTSKQQEIHHLRTVTVETRELTQTEKTTTTTKKQEKEFDIPPLHNLMADISSGNWGVLLGKSGSSSGSEAGAFSSAGPMGRTIHQHPPQPPGGASNLHPPPQPPSNLPPAMARTIHDHPPQSTGAMMSPHFPPDMSQRMPHPPQPPGPVSSPNYAPEISHNLQHPPQPSHFPPMENYGMAPQPPTAEPYNRSPAHPYPVYPTQHNYPSPMMAGDRGDNYNSHVMAGDRGDYPYYNPPHHPYPPPQHAPHAPPYDNYSPAPGYNNPPSHMNHYPQYPTAASYMTHPAPYPTNNMYTSNYTNTLSPTPGLSPSYAGTVQGFRPHPPSGSANRSTASGRKSFNERRFARERLRHSQTITRSSDNTFDNSIDPEEEIDSISNV